MIGLSLYFCFRDILSGKVSVDDVQLIITETKAVSELDWLTTIGECMTTYLRNFDTKDVMSLVDKMRKEERIWQPRIFGLPPANIADGHWVESMNQIKWMDP